jgi:hypothetical protein
VFVCWSWHPVLSWLVRMAKMRRVIQKECNNHSYQICLTKVLLY